MLAPSWRILYPKVLELSLRSVGFPMSLCPYAYLRVIPQQFLNGVWSRVSDNYWRVVQHLHPGPPAPYLFDHHSLSLRPPDHPLLLPCHCLGGALGISTKPFAAGPLHWGGSNNRQGSGRLALSTPKMALMWIMVLNHGRTLQRLRTRMGTSSSLITPEKLSKWQSPSSIFSDS